METSLRSRVVGIKLSSPHTPNLKSHKKTFSLSSGNDNKLHNSISLVRFAQSQTEALASASNTNIFLFNPQEEKGTCKLLNVHQRAITSLEWNNLSAHIFGSVSLDGQIRVWDARQGSAPAISKFTGISEGRSKLKWNRFSEHIFASCHGQQISIWDIRKNSAPILNILAHMTTISDVDWDYLNQDQIASGSTDNSIKFWNINKETKFVGTINTGSPVVQIRHIPSGYGIVSSNMHTHTSLALWSTVNLAKPIKLFSEQHGSSIVEFLWNMKNGAELISLSKEKEFVVSELNESDKKVLTSQTSKSALPVHIVNFSPLNLSQEFGLIKKEGIPGVTFTEMNMEERYCKISVSSSEGSKTQKIYLSIIFPQLYPHAAAPSFLILPESHIDNPQQKKSKSS
eukprot:TRINITY_DN7042_c0_g1_i1.p1 TRINITY_DN7042_c0_g1~~TRINITY_DN7042_c0_g1_i1.p1  ORF type:complete len:399 (-),score=67.61 TRINITY_DN7042_c0_g1_i1:302-1498(-)